MGIHYKQIFESGKSIVHFASNGQGDYALCGQDIAGDDFSHEEAYGEATITKEKVNCKDCISLVRYCKSLKLKECVG